MNVRSLVSCVALALLSGSAVSAADAPEPKPFDVRDLMTVSQFHQTGLDKLSPDELQALNAWLNDHTHATGAGPTAAAVAPAAPVAVSVMAAPAAVTVSGGGFGKEMMPPKPDPATPDVLHTRILGNFEGWSGRTVFKLENGQVWVQAETGTFDAHLENPEVVIKKLAFGYLLTLPGHGASVFVRRQQ